MSNTISSHSKIDIKKSEEQLLQKAEDSIKEGQVEEAIRSYQEILSLKPFNQRWSQLYINRILNLGISLKKEQFSPLLKLYPNLLEPLEFSIEAKSKFENVYHCSVPKTASTWLKRIFIDARAIAHSGLFPFQAEFINKSATIPLKSIVTGTFAINYNSFQKLEKPKEYRAFFVMRDPRDIVISAYFSNRYSHKLMDHIAETRKILESQSLEEGILYTIETLRDVFTILRSWVNGARDNPNILILRYEDITGEFAFQSFQKLFNHCDIKISDDLISEILEDYSFENMSQGRTQGSEDRNSHYRKGQHDDWKNYFNSTIRSKFEAVAEDLVGDLDYEWDGPGILGESYKAISRHISKKVTEASIQVDLEDRVENTLRTAHEAYQANQLDRSLSQYQNLIVRLESDLAHAYFYSGMIYRQKEQCDLAISFYEKAILLNSEIVDSYFFLGQIFAKQGQPEQAIESYQKFIAKKPEVPDVYFHLGILYSKQDRLDEAENNFKQFLRLRPEAADAHFYLGRIYFKQGKLEKAMSCYSKSLEYDSNLADAYFYMAEIYLKKGHIQKSMLFHEKYKNLKKMNSKSEMK